MKIQKITQLIYAPDEVTGYWELWAYGETDEGHAFCQEIDEIDMKLQADRKGCIIGIFHMAVALNDGTIDIFVQDREDNTNKVINIIPLFK